MTLCSRISTFVGLGDQVGATWTQKSRQRGPKWSAERSGQQSQATLSGRVRGALSELWNRPQTSPDSSQVGGKNLSKRQVI